MVFSVPSLVARLSAVVTLLPGDVIFTGHRPEWGSKCGLNGLVEHEQHDGDDSTGLFDVDDLLDQFVHGAIIVVDESGHQQVTRSTDRGIDF
jgi:2-keto-4-pentenoate hydratase/2-oxohepta-3-ene-1,7-dioic acid hydratase in catechol pathway